MRAQQERACTWTKRGTEGDKQETGQGGAGGLHTIPTSPQRSLARRPHRALQVAAMYWTVACKPRSTHWALPIARADGWKQATAAGEQGLRVSSIVHVSDADRDLQTLPASCY
ncbi:hypothetical protein VTI28DRAFT_5920 [Corynascus sepedonium]